MHDLCPGHQQKIPGKLTSPILHSQKATNYKAIIQKIFLPTIYKRFKYSEEQISKIHSKLTKLTGQSLCCYKSALITDLQERWGGKARR